MSSRADFDPTGSQEHRLSEAMRDIVRGQPFEPDVASIQRRARRARQRSVAVRSGTGVAVVGVAAAVAVATTASTHPGAPADRQAGAGPVPTGSGTSEPASSGTGGATGSISKNAPLVRLASDILTTSTKPAGDATLVIRTTSYPDGRHVTGADLYTDSGAYYWATSEAGLPAAIAAGDDRGSGMFAREVAAAIYAVKGNLATARTRMADAPLGHEPSSSLDHAGAAASSAARSAEQSAAARARERVFGTSTPRPVPASDMPAQAWNTDNSVWENSMDALIAGAGNPEVRAGAVRILSTLPEVSVASTTTGGQPTLTLTASSPAVPRDYQETLVIGARDGVPISFAGGTPGKTPSVTISYRVSRVTTAKLEGGAS